MLMTELASCFSVSADSESIGNTTELPIMEGNYV